MFRLFGLIEELLYWRTLIIIIALFIHLSIKWVTRKKVKHFRYELWILVQTESRAIYTDGLCSSWLFFFFSESPKNPWYPRHIIWTGIAHSSMSMCYSFKAASKRGSFLCKAPWHFERTAACCWIYNVFIRWLSALPSYLGCAITSIVPRSERYRCW